MLPSIQGMVCHYVAECWISGAFLVCHPLSTHILDGAGASCFLGVGIVAFVLALNAGRPQTAVAAC